MPKQDTTATQPKEISVKHIKKIEAQPTKTSANGDAKEIRTAPGLGAACIPVGV